MSLRSSFVLSIVAGSSVAAVSLSPAAAAPIPVAAQPAAAVIQHGQPYTATLQRLRVVRHYEFGDIRARPDATLGENRIDFRPMLNNPKALFNVAARLRALPQMVEVTEESHDVNEVEQGLLLHHVLSYRILPGQCAQPAARAALARAGVSCFTHATLEQRVAEFSTPGAPHYVADPARRGAAIAAYRQKTAQMEAELSQRVSQLRAMLNAPGQRAAIIAKVGPAEAARLASMSDEDLKGEIMNSAIQRQEVTAFMPRPAVMAAPRLAAERYIAAGAGETAAEREILAGGADHAPPGYAKLVLTPGRERFRTLGHEEAGGQQTTDIDLGTYIYLTGFTIGNKYEWSHNFSITINWCLVGCSSTYSVEPHAGFQYGFGLRFPIQAQLTYHNVVQATGGAQTTIKATYAPIQASKEQFEATGLSPDLVYNAQELVAQVGADAGVNYNLPVIGSGNPDFSVLLDLTSFLPPPYQGGSFLPPAPGSPGINTPYTFDQVDLLGGLLNFGAFGAQVFPAVNINLHSNHLSFQIKDEVANRIIKVDHSGAVVALATDPAHNNDSRFNFANPVYNLGFTLTPGIQPNVFLDLAVWSISWNPTIWFPQLAVDLPPGGMDFGCHAGTHCNTEFAWPKAIVVSGNALQQQLESMGCTRSGSVLTCTKVASYALCQPAVAANKILGVQTCNPGILARQLEETDRLFLNGGCQHNGSQILHFLDGPRTAFGFLCPIKKGDHGMLDLCNTVRGNGFVLSCGVLTPPPAQRILQGGACREEGTTGFYDCPAGMMGLCNDIVRGSGVILGCKLQH